MESGLLKLTAELISHDIQQILKDIYDNVKQHISIYYSTSERVRIYT
jgi:hypothetical protein